MNSATYNKIIIPGGAGYLGQTLARYFMQREIPVVILSRQAYPASEFVRYVHWDGATLGAWAEEFEQAAAVINLAGRSVNCRYNEANKRAIYESRLKSTKVLGKAIGSCATPPKVWFNSSSATIYRHAEDRPMDEATGEFGQDFSVDVVQQWERVFNEAPTPQTRKVALRAAMVFGVGKGGVFEAFHNIVKLGLGGTLGNGRQFVSWVHAEDFCRAIEWMMQHEELDGAVNIAVPNPLPNAEFMRIFRQACAQPIGFPATKWMLEIGAFFLQTETELLLKSRRVVPGRLLASGFHFQFPHFAAAIQDILEAEQRGS